MTVYMMETGCFEEIKALISRVNIQAGDNIQASVMGATPVNVENGVASIDIMGVLEPARKGIYDWIGIKQTAYPDIKSQIEQAEADPRVKNINLNISSGGGNHMGLVTTMDAIASTKKPTIAKITGMAASAAYMLATQADRIETESDGDMVGSNGSVTKFQISNNVKEITNRDSKDKRPDVTSDHGKAVVEDMLDDVFEPIVARIAKSRNVSVETVKNNYGNGALMTSNKAKELGMIDSVGFSDGGTDISNKINNKTSGISGQEKDLTMETLAELKAQHPKLYSQCYNTGVEAGKKDYQQLACNHLELAGLSGAMDRAVEDIKAGNEVTPAVSTYHSIQGIKKAQMDARGEEAPGAVGEGESPIEAAHDGEDNNKAAEEAQALFAKLGVEVE